MLRNHLNDFISYDFSSLSAELSETIAPLTGVKLTSNNFFDDEIKVFDLVNDIELVARITDASFLIGPDSQTLADYLQVANPSYFNSFTSSENSIQNRIDAIFDQAGGIGTSFKADFASSWEIVSGVGTAVYEGVVASLGGLGKLAESATAQSASFTGTAMENFVGTVQNSGVIFSTARVKELADYYTSLWNIYNSIGEEIGLAIQEGKSPGEMLGGVRLVSLLTDAVQTSTDLLDLIDVIDVPGPFTTIVGALNTFLKLAAIIEQGVQINAVRESESLSGLSQEFLDDAAFINATDLLDVVADAGQTLIGALNIGGQFIGAASATLEVVRTIGDYAAIGAKTPWQRTADVFESYTQLITPVGQYQDLLERALAQADILDAGTWGDTLASQVPAFRPAGEAILSSRFDINTDTPFERGGVLTVGQTYQGNIARFSGDEDWFEVTLEAGQGYRISLSTTTISQNGAFTLYDAAGREIGQHNIQLGNGTAKIAEGTVYETGTYYISVDTSGSTDDYLIGVNAVDFDGEIVELLEATDLTTTTAHLEVGETFVGYRNSASIDPDWIRLDLEAGHTYSIGQTGGRALNDMILYNRFGAAVAGFDRVNGGYKIEGTAQFDGPYFVGVNYSHFGSSYEISLTEVLPATGVSEFEDAAASTRTLYQIEKSVVFSGLINGVSPQEDDYSNRGSQRGDWFKVTLEAGKDYRFTTNLAPGFVEMNLRDSAGKIVAYESDALSQPRSAVMQGTAIASGAYFVSIDSANASNYDFVYEEVSLETTVTELVDAAEDTSTAYSLSAGQSFAGNLIRDDNDRSERGAINGDWIRVDLAAGDTVSAQLTLGTLARANFGLFDSDQNLIAETEVGSFTENQGDIVVLSTSVSQSGAYFLVIAQSGTGSYTVELAPSGTPAVNGTDIAENVNGTDASEMINAGGGGDWITPGEGSDTIDGGDGNDMLSFVTLADTPGRTNVQYRLDLDLTAGTATTSGSDVYTISNVERVTGSIFADRIKGDAGDNQLRGLGDYDWFTATTGADTIDGGTGQDMISYVDWLSDAVNTADTFNPGGAPPPNGEVTGVVVDLNDTSNNTNLAAGHEYISVERVTGSGRQDVFYGDENENDFRGLGDFDWFVGSTGGRERYFGGDGGDTVTYYNSTSGVSASLRNGAKVGGEETGRGTAGDAALDLYFSIENLVGTNFADNLTGNEQRNNLNGLSGDDFIFGYGGIDVMKGGKGNDVINGGAGSDYALFDGNKADTQLFRTAANEVRSSGAEGFDIHTDVEYFRFSDGDVSIWELAVV